MALRTRRRSTCRRTTSNGSVTLMTPGSHVTDRAVQAASGMWTVRRVTSGAIRVATGPRSLLFPARSVFPLASGPRPPPHPPSLAPPSLLARPSLVSPVGAGALWLAGEGQPWRSQLSGGSVAGCVPGWPTRGMCWQSHQVPPGHSSWCCFRHGTQIMSPLCGSAGAFHPVARVNRET